MSERCVRAAQSVPAGCRRLAASFISCSFHCDKSKELQLQVRVHLLEVSLVDRVSG